MSAARLDARRTVDVHSARLTQIAELPLQHPKTAVAGGYLINEKDRQGRAYRLVPGDALPPSDGLPTVEELEVRADSDRNTVTVQTSGRGEDVGLDQSIDARDGTPVTDGDLRNAAERIFHDLGAKWSQTPS